MRFLSNNSAADADEVQVPFIPMADLMFNLLIFFILTSIFAVLETQIGIELPSATASEAAARNLRTIIINVDAQGNIRLNDLDFTMERLEETLKSLVKSDEESPSKDRTSVIIRADKNTRHGRIIEILDACTRVDIQDVGFMTLKERPPSGNDAASGGGGS